MFVEHFTSGYVLGSRILSLWLCFGLCLGLPAHIWVCTRWPNTSQNTVKDSEYARPMYLLVTKYGPAIQKKGGCNHYLSIPASGDESQTICKELRLYFGDQVPSRFFVLYDVLAAKIPRSGVYVYSKRLNTAKPRNRSTRTDARNSGLQGTRCSTITRESQVQTATF